MIKQISTYGAALLTAMVVVRAATMEEQKDVSNQYQRTADLSYEEDNLALRDDYSITEANLSGLLAFNAKAILEHPPHNSATIVSTETHNLQSVVNRPAIDLVEDIEINPEDLELLTSEPELTESENLSLDRESTINSGLSILFNRERILPKPTRIALEE